MTLQNLSRRSFLAGIGITGGGLVVGLGLQGCSAEAPPTFTTTDFAPDAFLQITPQNEFRFICARDEMGQGVSSGLATLFGEELDVDPTRFDVSFPGVHSAYGHPAFSGIQSTGGSAAMRGHYLPARQAAANVRDLILEAAAQDLNVEKSKLSTDNGEVIAGEQRYPYAQFITTAQSLPIPEAAPMKAPEAFRYIGQDVPRLDAAEKSTGEAVYGIDFDIPGMKYALMKRSPMFGGSVNTFVPDDIQRMPGVVDVVEISNGVAVVADTFWQAKKALDQLNIEWDTAEAAKFSTADLRADYQTALDEQTGSTTDEEGDLALAFRNGDTQIEVDFWAPYLAHAPLEPMNAVVKVENGEAEVWTGLQGPPFAQASVARALNIDKAKVRVHNTYLGGGFGRRLLATHVAEAAEIAAATGHIIKLIWTREDDIQNGVFRPASLMRMKASLDSEGTINGWMAKRVGGNILPDRMVGALPVVAPDFVPDGVLNSVVGLADTAMSNWIVDGSSVEGLAGDYDLPNRVIEHVTVNHGLPLSYWRSVGHSYTAFAKESAIDVLAEAAAVDPVELRLNNTRSNPRQHNVIKVASERMKSMEAEKVGSLGFAAHSSFHSYVAQVADVSVQGSDIVVNKVLCVVDCGRAINPDVIRAQMEGAIMFGLTAALHGDLDIADGRVVQSNFHDYPLLRMNEHPDVEVIIIDNDEDPTGVGEVGLPPIAPAVANAVFAETGQRLTSLPLRFS